MRVNKQGLPVIIERLSIRVYMRVCLDVYALFGAKRK
jgi:hypothetical protein